VPNHERRDEDADGRLMPGPWSRISVALSYGSLAAAVCFVALYVGLAVMRMRYPFELEWMEGGAVRQVAWILSGHKLYVRPSLEFTPWVYPPLYFYVSAAMSWLLSEGFFPLRLVSFVCSLGSIGLVFALVRRETGNRQPAMLSAGLFAATYQAGGTWFDLARSDSLFLVLLLASVYVLRTAESARTAALAGILLSLSFFSKQTALVVALPLALYCAATDWRRAVWLVGTTALVVGGGTLLLDIWQDGWFSYYVFTVPGQLSSRVIPERVVYFWTRDVGLPLAIASALALFYIAKAAVERSRRGWFHVAVAAGMFAGSWIPRMQSGGYTNTLIPAFAAVCVLFGLGLNEARRLVQRSDPPLRFQLVSVLELLLAVQFAAMVYNPLAVLPKPGDLEAGRRIVQRLARIEGDVFVFSQSYLASMAGKPATAHAAAILDVLGWGGAQESASLQEALRAALHDGRFKAVVLDERNDAALRTMLDRYQPAGRMLDDPRAFWPVTGYRVRPEQMYVLQEPSRQDSKPRNP